ncbi:unnamed protein product [Protopolystoma xenopodis]|uniref:Uncharacterized protein n=1 Tax=Protopolystoma xenopodis TaxID=117903 RepID=A0A448XT86_9PLAT|nr:unnamed protein product [Protopolystoma xenopodis]
MLFLITPVSIGKPRQPTKSVQLLPRLWEKRSPWAVYARRGTWSGGTWKETGLPEQALARLATTFAMLLPLVRHPPSEPLIQRPESKVATP